MEGSYYFSIAVNPKIVDLPTVTDPIDCKHSIWPAETPSAVKSLAASSLAVSSLAVDSLVVSSLGHSSILNGLIAALAITSMVL